MANVEDGATGAIDDLLDDISVPHGTGTWKNYGDPRLFFMAVTAAQFFLPEKRRPYRSRCLGSHSAGPPPVPAASAILFCIWSALAGFLPNHGVPRRSPAFDVGCDATGGNFEYGRPAVGFTRLPSLNDARASSAIPG